MMSGITLETSKARKVFKAHKVLLALLVQLDRKA